MRFWVILFITVLAGSFSIAQQNTPQQVSQNPTGRWESVDFVGDVNNFNPEKQNMPKQELFFKQAGFRSDGTTDSFFTWQGDLIQDNESKIKAQFYIRQINGTNYLFLPWLSGDVTIRGQKTQYYVLRKVSDNAPPAAAANVSGNSRQESAQRSFQTIRPVDSVNEYDDVRWKDLGSLDLSRQERIIETLTFNEKTVWPAAEKRPGGAEPNKILAAAMNPGLGVSKLHRQGITGRGVNVAIIDQPLYQDHPEFAGKIAAYHDVGCQSESSMHGPAVASLLAGTNCGTAPDARVYYVAAPSWTKDSAFQAKALDWIIEQNAKLPPGGKIRVVSVSAAPSGEDSPFEKNQQTWDEACARAEAAGILVLDCTQHHGFIGSCWLNSSNVEDVNLCTPGFPGQKGLVPVPGKLLAPTCPRTTAEQYNKNEFSYQYCGRGGLSWAIPYVAGVLAMGWQARPDLSAEQMKDILLKSAYTTADGAKIINPVEFISMLKKASRMEKKTAARPVSQNPIGKWQAVDFVREINDFVPGAKPSQVDLVLGNLEFFRGGKTSGVWTWRAGFLYHPGDRTNAKFVIKEIDGSTYMFLEWKSGDVILGHQKSEFYVLKKISADDTRPPRQ